MKKKLWIVGALTLSGSIAAAVVLGAMTLGAWVIAGIVPILLGLLAAGYWKYKRREPAIDEGAATKQPRPSRPKPAPIKTRGYDQDDPAYLAQRLLEQGRYALLLRPQIAANIKADQLQAAMQYLDESMGIVPEGDVLLQSWMSSNNEDDDDGQRERLVHVEALYLDRHPVTNEQFQKFVDDGGYENISFWDSTIWPAVLDFVDQTGHPGPRGWTDGHFPPGKEDHPVVGVSWYEGAAYARWAGKRLPSDPEWVKAGCWPVLTQGTRPMQRRFPWGDTMDRELAHLWGSGINDTVSVYELSDGVSVGGIYHLIGNVWEWTSSSFGVWDATARKLETSTPMKSIRGGAFDTYFDTQATCQFQSGDSPIARKHNIGFRCALALCDVISTELESTDDEQESLVACGTNAEGEVL